MKLILCPKCATLVSLANNGKTTYCKCRKCCGKYLSNLVDAVITERAIVVGIDNNSFFNYAVKNYYKTVQDFPNTRIDMYFTGWIPNLPGEVIKVKTVKEVVHYQTETNKPKISTLPSKDVVTPVISDSYK